MAKLVEAGIHNNPRDPMLERYASRELVQFAEDFGKHGLSQILLASTPGQSAADQFDDCRVQPLNQGARRIIVSCANFRNPSFVTDLSFGNSFLRMRTGGTESPAPEITEYQPLRRAFNS